MKLLLLLLSFVLVSCGGSSSGGGNNDQVLCDKSLEKCRPDFYRLNKATGLRKITKEVALKMLMRVEPSLVNIKKGSRYIKVEKCIANYQGIKVDEKVLSEYIVLSYDSNSREIRAKVTVEDIPANLYCFTQSNYPDKEYISISYVPTESEAEMRLDDFTSFKQGVIGSSPAVAFSKKENDTTTEFGINLNLPYNLATYFEMSVVDSQGTAARQIFSLEAGTTDTSNIDITGLPEVYESM